MKQNRKQVMIQIWNEQLDQWLNGITTDEFLKCVSRVVSEYGVDTGNIVINKCGDMTISNKHI